MALSNKMHFCWLSASPLSLLFLDCYPGILPSLPLPSLPFCSQTSFVLFPPSPASTSPPRPFYDLLSSAVTQPTCMPHCMHAYEHYKLESAYEREPGIFIFPCKLFLRQQKTFTAKNRHRYHLDNFFVDPSFLHFYPKWMFLKSHTLSVQ